MSYSIAQSNDSLAGIVHGKTVNKITNLYSVHRRAAQNLLSMIDPDETRVISTITLYDKVVDYVCPVDLKDKKVVDIRPQFTTNNSRSYADNLSNRMSKDFDFRRRYGSWFTVMNNGGVKYLRVKTQQNPSATTLDPLNTLGGWAATSPATSLAKETTIYTGGALTFNMSSGANPITGYIQSSTITSQNMTTLVNQSAAFVEVYIPSAAALAAIVSFDLRWGNDNTANYYNRTITTGHITAFKVGKNTLRFDWNGATQTGTVDATKIDSARISVTTNGTAVTGLIASNLFFSLANVWDIEYYSKYLFSNTSGVWSDTITSDNDTVNLDTTTFNLYTYELALAGLQQIQGKDAMADRNYFYKELHGDAQKPEGMYAIYKKNNPSQAEKVTQTWYPVRGFRSQFRGRFNR